MQKKDLNQTPPKTKSKETIWDYLRSDRFKRAKERIPKWQWDLCEPQLRMSKNDKQ